MCIDHMRQLQQMQYLHIFSSGNANIIVSFIIYQLTQPTQMCPTCLVLLTEGSSDRRRRIPFRIPHSLVFLPNKQEVCVADRENGRIQCFIAETGEFVKEVKKEEFEGEVFAITYSPAGSEFRHYNVKLSLQNSFNIMF